MKKLRIYPQMNPSKFVIQFIIFTILMTFPTLAFKKTHKNFTAIEINKFQNQPKYCSCHRKEALKKMAAVEFINGHKYLISEEPMGRGATSMVFHAIYFGQKWELEAKAKTDCVAIKVAGLPKTITNNMRIKKELANFNDIFHQYSQYSIWPPPNHILRCLRSENFFFKNDLNFAIVMELGDQNLYEYWQKVMVAKQRNKKVSETMLLCILHKISSGLQQLHERNYIFIDLKPQNVMIMPKSPNPKELNDKNCEKLRIKLTDFGGSLKFTPDENGKQILSENDQKYVMSTLFYGAPELYNQNVYQVSPKTDIYSLGRLMLILIVLTPEIKKFTPKINKYWVDEGLDRKYEENHQNWIRLVNNMLEVVNIPPKIEQSNVIVEVISDHETDTDSDMETNEFIEGINKEREKKEEKFKRETDEKNENQKALYMEMKKNYGHLMEIIEQTQAIEQDQRPTVSAIIKECSPPKLAHILRSQTERKSNKDSSTPPLFHSGALITRNSDTDSSGRSFRKGISSKSFRKSLRWSLDSIPFLN